MKNKMMMFKEELLFRLKELSFINFFRCLKYSLKNSLRVLMFLLIIGFVVYIIPLLSMTQVSYERTTNVGLIVTFVACACYFVPLVLNSYRMNKRSIDVNYSLPISKFALSNVKLVTGLVLIVVSYTVLYWIGFIFLSTKFAIPNPGYYVPLYFIILALTVSLYIYNFFIVSRGNTLTDAVILLVFNTFLLAMIFVGINESFRIIRNYFPKDFEGHLVLISIRLFIMAIGIMI